ncbi:MAG: sulfatase-like hydrolase/transferase [Acidobacteriota bacterium]
MALFRVVVLASCLLLVGSSFVARAGETDANVVLVVLDDWGVDWFGAYDESRRCTGTNVGCQGDADCTAPATCDGDYPITPALDRLAQEGMLFRNAWANPVCSPTRASFLTGRHGFRTGVLAPEAPDNRLQDDELTVAEVLLDPGLTTRTRLSADIGKWHLAGGMRAPRDQGFDHHAGILQGGVADYFAWSRTVDGMTEDCSPGSVACPLESYATTVMIDDALAWLSGRADPWFLYLALIAPHDPFQVPPHDLLSPETLARMPEDAAMPGMPAPEGTECMGRFTDDCYLAMLEATDRELDRLLMTLTEPTHVILIGDNGTPGRAVREPFDSARAKNSLFEGGVNVPFIIRHAEGLGAGLETEALVHVVDLFSTLLELMGACPPEDRVIDGVSLVPLLSDPDAEWTERVHAQNLTGRTVRDRRFKLIRDNGIELLYDLAGDPPATAADPFEDVDLLLGSCSTSATDCHLDSECPMGETCVVPPLEPVAALHLAELRDHLDALVMGSGAVPDGTLPGDAPLRLEQAPGGQLALSWGPSCSSEDVDFAVHEGELVAGFLDHRPLTCTTAGATSTLVTPGDGSRYYLVVPSSATAEGSYGHDSAGRERASSPMACSPQLVRPCPDGCRN